MARKRKSSDRQEGLSKRKKETREDVEGPNNAENETWQERLFIDSSKKEKELSNKEELDGVGISDGVVVINAKLDKLYGEMMTMKKELEEKVNAGVKAVIEEIDARFKALTERMATRKEQRKDSSPKSYKAVARYSSIPVQAHTPEIETLLKEVTKSTSSEENKSETKTSSSSEEFCSSSSEEVEEVTTVAPRSSAANKKMGPAPTRRSSRIAGK